MKQLAEMIDRVIHFIDDTLVTLQAFEDSKRRSEYILGMVEEAVLTTDEKSTILSINSYFSQKTGWTSDDVIGKSICDFILENHLKEVRRLMRFNKEGIFLNKEVFEFKGKNNDIVSCKLSICRMVRNDGKQRYIFLLK